MAAARDQARQRVGVAPLAVAPLLGGRTVEAQTVGLHHDAELGPLEVHPETVHVGLGEWLRQSGGAPARLSA